MAELRGGTTIGGYIALHSGLQEAYLSGNLTLSGKITAGGKFYMGIGSTNGIIGASDKAILLDHNNGNVTLSATGGALYLGYQNTTGTRLQTNLYGNDGTTLIVDTARKLYYQGQDTDVRYVRMASDAYISADTTGSTSYPRLIVNNSGASTPGWLRVNSDTTGFLPYSNGQSFIGTSSWKFKEIHGLTFYENGTSLDAKYLGISAKAADSDKLDGIDSASFMRSDADDTITGKISVGSTTSRQAGMYGIYDPAKIGHIWSMGTGYVIPADGSNFGNLYGLAYKHTNNTTGGTMGGGHQMLWVVNGTPTVSLGTNIWTSGSLTSGNGTFTVSTGGNVSASGTIDGTDIKASGTLSAYGSEFVKYLSATTGAIGWYRIANSGDVGMAWATFEISAYPGNDAQSFNLIVNRAMSGDAIGLIQMNGSTSNNTLPISKARMVYQSGNIAYLEVYVTVASTYIAVRKISGSGFISIAPNTAGSIPTGYSTYEIVLSGTGASFPSLTRLNSVELGNGLWSASPGTQAGFIDLHSSGGGYNGAIDYDARIISWWGDKAATGKGSLQFISGAISLGGDLNQVFAAKGANTLPMWSPWTNYGDSYQPAYYWKSADGWVHVQGLVKSNGGGNGSWIAVLPAGYRPNARMICNCYTAGGPCRVDIASDGVISFEYGSADNSWLSLENISFRGEK